MVSSSIQVGTGQRIAGQSAGVVVFVIVGHGVTFGGSVVIPVITDGKLLVLVVCVVSDVTIVVIVGVIGFGDVVGYGRLEDVDV